MRARDIRRVIGLDLRQMTLERWDIVAKNTPQHGVLEDLAYRDAKQ